MKGGGTTVIMEMQITTTTIYHLKTLRMAITKNLKGESEIGSLSHTI